MSVTNWNGTRRKPSDEWRLTKVMERKDHLGLPRIEDRLIQQCILQVLEPICEAKFHDRSNGFRPNRGVENALAQAEKLITEQTNCISWWILTLKDFSIMSATENY